MGDQKGQEDGTGTQPAVDMVVLIDQLKLLLSNPEAAVAGGADVQRHQLRQLMRSAVVAIEDPFETLLRFGYCPLPLVTARISLENNIFATLAAAKEPVGLAVLQDVSGLEPSILESIVSYLCTQDMAHEVGPGRYSATKLTHLLMAPVFQAAIIHFHDASMPAFAALNSVLGNGPAANQNAFKVGHSSGVGFYRWMESHPVQQNAFHQFMEAQFASLPTWLDVVNFESELANGITGTNVAFVDVGGGSGQQCAAFRKKLPQVHGRIILQDRPDILIKAITVDGMEKMDYDYLEEQPVKGARVYYFRQIMHNNDDETCIRILQSQVPAMGPESVIVIDDKVLPDERPPPGAPSIEYIAGLNLAMKTFFDSQERRESHWRQLLDNAGFEVKGIRKFSEFHDAAIIITPKRS